MTSRSAELRDVGRVELHEVARRAGADARLEVVAALAELRDVGRVAQVAQEHDTRR